MLENDAAVHIKAIFIVMATHSVEMLRRSALARQGFGTEVFVGCLKPASLTE